MGGVSKCDTAQSEGIFAGAICLSLQQSSPTSTAPLFKQDRQHIPKRRKPPQREVCALSTQESGTATAGAWNLINELESHRGLYTVAELASVLGKSPWTIYRMANRKQIPSLIISGSLMFDPSTLGMHYRRKYPQLAEAARYASRAA